MLGRDTLARRPAELAPVWTLKSGESEKSGGSGESEKSGEPDEGAKPEDAGQNLKYMNCAPSKSPKRMMRYATAP